MSKSTDKGISIWDRFEFSERDIDVHHATGEKWFAARKTLREPYCWTPTKDFWFGGKLFKKGYPCAAHATTNFGFIIQRQLDGMQIGKE